MRKSYVIGVVKIAWIVFALLLLIAAPMQTAHTAESTPSPSSSSAGYGDKPIITKENAKSLVPLAQFGGTAPTSVSNGYLYGSQIAAWSPDGAWIAYNAQDGLRLMSLQAFSSSRRLVGHREGVGALSFSPDSTRLVTGSSDNTIRLWDVASGKEVWHQQIATGGVINVAFSPDGSVIATSDLTNVVKLWNPADGTPLATLESGLEPARGQSLRMTFSSDGHYLAVAFLRGSAEGGAIVVWEVASRTVKATLTQLTSQIGLHDVKEMAFNADTLAIMPEIYSNEADGSNTSIYLWRPGIETEAQPLPIVDAEGAPIRVSASGKMYWLADGKTLLITSSDYIVLYQPGAETPLQAQWENDTTSFYFFYAVSPDGSILLAGDYNTGNLVLLEASTGRVITTAVINVGMQRDLGVSPDGTLVAFNIGAGTDQAYVRLLNLITGESRDFLLPEDGGFAINFSADNSRMLVLSGGNMSAAVLDLNSGEVISTILDERQTRGFGVSYGAITADGQRVLLAGDNVGDGASGSWYDANTGALIGQIRRVGHMKLSPDGTIIATFDPGRGIGTTLINVQTGAVIAKNETAYAHDASFSADSTKLILDSGAILDTKTGQFLRPAIKGVGGTSSLSPDGSLLAISSPQLRVFDTASGTDVSSSRGENIKKVVFAAGGRVLVVQREDSVQVLGVDETATTVATPPSVPEVAYWDKNCVLTLSTETGENPVSLFKSSGSGCGYGDNDGIRWSPDGSKLLIGWDVYDVEGHKLLNIPYQINGPKPKFSADGKQVYVDTQEGILLYTIGTDTPQNVAPRTRTTGYSYPNMSSDGRTMYAYSSNKIVAIDIASGQIRKQITKSGGLKPLERFGSMPHVAPNGQQLAVIYFVPDNQQDQIVIMDSDGTNQRLLNSSPNSGPLQIRQMEWSPDGTKLAIIHNGSSGGFSLTVIDVQTGTSQQLVPDIQLTSPDVPFWTADSKRLAVSVNYVFNLVNADGSGMTPFPIEGAKAVAFNPQPNGTTAAITANPTAIAAATNTAQPPTVAPSATPQPPLPSPSPAAIASNTGLISLDLAQHYVSPDLRFSFDYPATLTLVAGMPYSLLVPSTDSSGYVLEVWVGIEEIYSVYPPQEGCMIDEGAVEASVAQALDTLIECTAAEPSFNPQDIQSMTLNGKSTAYHAPSGLVMVNLGNGVPALLRQTLGDAPGTAETYQPMLLAIAGSVILTDASAQAATPIAITQVPTPTLVAAPTAVICAGSPPPRLVIGSQARILPGSANNLNSKPARPSLDASSKKIGSIPVGGVFTVLDGPVCNHGIIWWQVDYQGNVGWTGEADSAYWAEPIN